MNSRTHSFGRFLGGLVVFVLLAGAALAQTVLTSGTVGTAYTYTITTTPPAAVGTSYSATLLPPGLSINASTGIISGTPTTAGTYGSGTISLLSSGTTNTFAVSITINPLAATPVVTSAATASGTVGAAFTYAAAASNSPTSFNVGALPAGLTANTTTGAISGTPSTAGSYTVSLSANNSAGTGATVTVNVTIAPALGAPVITGTTAASGPVNVAFSYAIAASNSATSYSAAGLPLGLSLNTGTGAISGTPTVAGVSSVTLTATNAAGTSPVFTLTITVGSLPTITSATVNAGVGAAFNYTLTASNSPTSFNIGVLPPGLSGNTATGVISGTPTTTGTYLVTVSANNSTGTGSAATLTIALGNLPAITSAAAASGTAGSAFGYTVTASNTPTSFTVSGLPAGLTANTTTGVISGIPSASGTSAVTLSATNAFGTGSNATLTITVAAAPIGGGGGGGGGVIPATPAITSAATASGVVGTAFSYAITATNFPTSFSVGTLPAGLTANTTTGVISGTPTAAGISAVAISGVNAFGAGSAATLTITISATADVGTAPTITTQPADQVVAAGASASFTVVATGPAPLSYQWRRNGTPIGGATNATFTLASVQSSDLGNYDVVVTNSKGSITSATARLALPVSRLTSVAVRSVAGTGDQTLIVGFAINSSAAKQMLIRGVGPALTQYGVSGVLADPQLKLFNSASVQIGQNDDWAGDAALSAVFTRTGAFALPATSKDAALLTSLTGGAYSAYVTAAAGTGVALLEAYDADTGTPASRVVSLSARSMVGQGDNILIVGFAISGTENKTLLIRGVGPTLTQYGVSGVLADPQLKLFNSAGVQIGQNDDWGGGAALANAFTATYAFALPAASKDAALLVTLAPGVYTAQVSGVGNTTGIALIEVYEVP
jgi:hypothetical protein